MGFPSLGDDIAAIVERNIGLRPASHRRAAPNAVISYKASNPPAGRNWRLWCARSVKFSMHWRGATEHQLMLQTAAEVWIGLTRREPDAEEAAGEPMLLSPMSELVEPQKAQDEQDDDDKAD